jgi:hypothetical protein
MTHKSEDFNISAVKYYLKNKDNYCMCFDMCSRCGQYVECVSLQAVCKCNGEPTHELWVGPLDVEEDTCLFTHAP